MPGGAYLEADTQLGAGSQQERVVGTRPVEGIPPEGGTRLEGGILAGEGSRTEADTRLEVGTPQEEGHRTLCT